MRKTVRALFALTLSCWASAAAAADHLVLQLGWSAEPEFGGYFQAAQTGIYRQFDLDTEIKLGSPQTNALQLLLAGRADFAIAPNSAVLNAARQGFPLVAVAAIFQRDPRVIIAHQGAGNDTLEAIKGKPIMVAASDQVTFWPFLRQKYGYSDSQIRPYTFNSGPFMADKNAVQQGFVTNEPFALRKMGADIKVILLSDYGYQTYAQTIVTTRKMIDAHPALVQRFVDATIKGWYGYLYGDSALANEFIKKNSPEQGDDQIAYSRDTIKQMGLVDSDDAKKNGIGTMSDEAWGAMFAQMSSVGLYPANMDYRAAYTLQFVNKRVGL